jgi:hypothetical protein
MLKEYNFTAAAEFAKFQPKAAQIAQKRSSINAVFNTCIVLAIGLLIIGGLYAISQSQREKTRVKARGKGTEGMGQC